MSAPGFTAEASLYLTKRSYRAVSAMPDAIGAADLKLALFIDPTNPKPDVDCNTFPDGITCNECGATGPGTFDCCKLAGKGSGKCVIIPYKPRSFSALSTVFY